MDNVPLFSHIVLQPTTLCNLNCRYCYLPDRDKVDTMTPDITTALAANLSAIEQEICLVWHGGEPLATRIRIFRELIDPFRDLYEKNLVRHSIQTNATLITQEWCDFLKKWNFQVGVSIDGNESQNQERVTITGVPAFQKIMHGIDLLKKNHIPFSVIATVNPKNIDDPFSFYNFFASLGCSSLNINIEEKEGFNQKNSDLGIKEVYNFWKNLFLAWKQKPTIRIRELDMTLGYIGVVLEKQKRGDSYKKKNGHYGRGFWPTITFNGNVTVLSPEFVSVHESERDKFVVGNILENSLQQIIINSQNTWYVKDFFKGIHNCKLVCPYYEFCGGGQASNKYFELGDISGTETTHCRNSRQLVMDAVLDSLTNSTKTIL